MPEPRKQHRRQETERKLIDATERLIAERGFDKVGVTAIAAEAQVPKELIYRYFGGVDEIIDALMENKDFWSGAMPENILTTAADGRDGKIDLSRFLVEYARSLRAEPLFKEVRRWELLSKADFVLRRARQREKSATDLLNRIGIGSNRHAMAKLAIIQAGITYLALRESTLNSFYGVRLDTDEGWGELHASLEELAETIERFGESKSND